MGLRLAFWVAMAVALLAMLPAPARAADPDALWKIVGGKCVPDQQLHGDPAPCARVDLAGGAAKGFALLKDISGTTHYLLIPTARIEGIESPAILAPDATNYFAEAWKNRDLVQQRAGVPLSRDQIGLAINSVSGRTQDQLHIHMDCVKPEVRTALRRHDSEIGPKWAPLTPSLAGHHYLAMKLDGEGLDAANPFELLAGGIPGARAHMGDQTLAAIGAIFADGKPGFYLLDDHADLLAGDLASGEQLLDRSCARAHS